MENTWESDFQWHLLISFWMTMAQIEKMQSKKVFFSNLD